MLDKITHNEHHEGSSGKKDGLAGLETSVTVGATKDKLAETKKDPTLTGMSNAKDNLAKAIREDNPKDAREAMLLLHAYGALGEQQKNGIYKALHGISFNGSSMESYIKYKNYKNKDGKTTALGYAMALFLRSAGYIDKEGFEKAFAYDPILETGKKDFSDWIAGEQSDELESAIDKYKQLLDSRDFYLNKYTDRYVFSDADNTALYDKLVSGSVSERDGWLLAAKKLPLIEKLHQQKSAPKDLNELLDDNPNNNKQELMFLELYLLADSEIVPVSIQEDPKDNGLLIKPGALYEKTLLGYVEKFINKKNRAPEQLSYEDQLAALESTIHRLVTAADVADSEKKGENVDHNLEYSVEEKILSLNERIKNDQMYEDFQNIVKTYITNYLFKHSTQTGRFAKLVSLLDAKNQQEVLLAYTQLEPKLDTGLVETIGKAINFETPPTNTPGAEYVSPLAVGPTGGNSLKQFGDEYINDFNNLSHLSLDDLGGLYTQLLQIIGGKKLDGTPWHMPILDTAFNTVDPSGELLSEQNKLLGLPDGIDVVAHDESINFIDPRLSFLFQIQDIYLMKLMENGDDASREKAVDFALALSQETGGTDIAQTARDSFVEGIAGVISFDHLKLNEDELTKSLDKATKELPKHVFGGFPEYTSIKNRTTQEIISGIDDTVFSALIGAGKEEFLTKAGNKEFSKLTLADQMSLFTVFASKGNNEKIQSISSDLAQNLKLAVDTTIMSKSAKIFSLNENGMSAREKQLFAMVEKTGDVDLKDFYIGSSPIAEAGRGGAILNLLFKLFKRNPGGGNAGGNAGGASTRLGRFFEKYGRGLKNFFIGSTAWQFIGRIPIGILFYASGSLLDVVNVKILSWMLKIGGFAWSIPGGAIAMALEKKIKNRFSDKVEDVNNLPKEKQIDHKFVNWKITETNDVVITKGEERMKTSKIPIIGRLIEKATTETLIQEFTCSIKPIFDESLVNSKYNLYKDDKDNSKKTIELVLPNPGFEISFKQIVTKENDDALVYRDGSAIKNMEEHVQTKALAEALYYAITGKLKDENGNNRTIFAIKENYKNLMIKNLESIGFKKENIQISFQGDADYSDASQNVEINWDVTKQAMKNTGLAPLIDKLSGQYKHETLPADKQ